VRPVSKPEKVVSRTEEAIFYPARDDDFLIPHHKAELDVVHELSQENGIANVIVTGSQGNGKTSLGLQFAATYNRPCVVIDFGGLQEPQQLFLTVRLLEGEQGSFTDFQPSSFVIGVERENCVVILDELNRPESARVLNALFPFLDYRRGAYISDLRRWVNVAKGVVFFATLNEGYQFVGTFSLDEALRDRLSFTEIQMPLPPMDILTKIIQRKAGITIDADRIAKFVTKVAEQMEGVKLSVRQAITMGKKIAAGDPLYRAAFFTIGRTHDKEWREAVLQILQMEVLTPAESERLGELVRSEEWESWR